MPRLASAIAILLDVWTFFLCSAKKIVFLVLLVVVCSAASFCFVVWFYLGSYLVVIKNEMTRETHKKKAFNELFTYYAKELQFLHSLKH